MLRLMRDASLVIMRDVGIANAGVVYARPGSLEAEDVLLSSNQRSRGHVFSRIQPHSAVLSFIHCIFLPRTHAVL